MFANLKLAGISRLRKINKINDAMLMKKYFLTNFCRENWL